MSTVHNPRLTQTARLSPPANWWRQIFYFWPYLLIGISVGGLAYLFWPMMH